MAYKMAMTDATAMSPNVIFEMGVSSSLLNDLPLLSWHVTSHSGYSAKELGYLPIADSNLYKVSSSIINVLI